MSEEQPLVAPKTGTPTVRQVSAFISAAFAVITILAIYYYVTTPVIPSTFELQQISQYREVGGNGMKLLGIFLFALGSGLCSMLGLVGMLSAEDSDRRERESQNRRSW